MPEQVHYPREHRESEIMESMMNHPDVKSVIELINKSGSPEEVKSEKLSRIKELVALGDTVEALETGH